MEPKETHYSGPSSRIKGFKTWNFSEENWKKVLDVKWICVALVKSVVSVKGEEICGFCKGNHCGNMSDNGENSAEDSTMKVEALKAEKRKLKAAITRQLNELAGRVAGVSGGVEPRSLEEMESIKATLERLETIKEKTFEILEELRTLYQQQKDTERQVKVGDEADELNQRIEGEATTSDKTC